MEIFKQNFSHLREINQMTQAEVGDILGVTYQTISKWETGKSLPDITLLALISKTFKVTIDQLLGLVPIDYTTYTPRGKDSKAYRDTVLDQFVASRTLFWNEDYLRFLVRDVWCLNSPIKVADISCGNGLLADQLMPLLPEGSHYTGFEVSPVMRDNTSEDFKSSPHMEILPMEDINDYDKQFDVVICQSYLRHLSRPMSGLKKMQALTKKGGLLICHEVNRPFETVGLLLGDETDDTFEKMMLLEKLWQTELKEEGRDYRLGLRLPLMLKSIGLSHINCRMNDHIDVILGREEDQEVLTLLNRHYKTTSVTEDGLYEFLLQRGMNRFEALRYIQLYECRKTFMDKPSNEMDLVHYLGMVICWGIV